MTSKPILKTNRVRRTHIIKVRASAQEYANLFEQAGETALAVFIRQQLLSGDVVSTKRQARKTPSKHDRDNGCAVLAREVARVGNNLNQLARAVNQLIKVNKPIDSLILSMRLFGIWEQLYVLQNLQARQRESNRDRLSDESQGCQRAGQEHTSTANEG